MINHEIDDLTLGYAQGEAWDTDVVCRTDSQLTAVQCLYSQVASRAPLFEIYGSESGLFRVYIGEFE
ncbi:MAG: hypothetical protein GQ475_07315 [Methylococcaceae bacterium]|nr:hypothetical protein [Methylococcaceae bacterium]